MQAQTREILSCSNFVTYVQSPSNLLEIFLFLFLIHPKISTFYITWQNTLCQICTTLFYTKKTTLCTPLLYTKKTTTLWMIIMNPISLETYMWSWTRSLISGLSEFFTKNLNCVMKWKWKLLFWKIEIFNRVSNKKLIFLVGLFILRQHP